MGRWGSLFPLNSCPVEGWSQFVGNVPPLAPIRASVVAASAGSPPGAAHPPGRLSASGPGRSRAPSRCLYAYFARFARSVELAGTGLPALPRRSRPGLAGPSCGCSPPPLAATLRTSLSGRSAPPCALRAPGGNTPTCRASGLKPSRARFARPASRSRFEHADARYGRFWRAAGPSGRR